MYGSLQVIRFAINSTRLYLGITSYADIKEKRAEQPEINPGFSLVVFRTGYILLAMAESQGEMERQGRIALSATSEYACYPLATQQVCWATTSLKAPFYEPAVRAPVDVVAVIDKSGSMRGGKLELVKKTLLFVIDQRKSQDIMYILIHVHVHVVALRIGNGYIKLQV